MLTEERYRLINQLLANHAVVKLSDIVDVTGASESTIRRDLVALEEAGVLVRVHGGAKRKLSMDEEPSMTEKAKRFLAEKERIGKYAASLIEVNDYIYLDAGTTTLAMVPYIETKGITVVTNGIELATQLAAKGIRVMLLGGILKPRTLAMIGSIARDQLAQYQFSKAFMGMNAVDSQYGFTTPDSEEAAIKQLAIKKASQAFILVDGSKFDTVNFYKVCDLDDGLIITSGLSDELLAHYVHYTKVKEV